MRLHTSCTRRRRFVLAAVCGSVLLAALGSSLGSTARAAEKPGSIAASARTDRQANAFLDRLGGFWEGEGEFQGTPIIDELHAGRTLDGQFLRIETYEIDGAGFRSEMYAGWDPLEQRYELYFFSNFTGFGQGLPVRVMTGRRSGNKLIFAERRSEPQPRRFTFELVDDDTMVLTKIIYHPTEELLSTEEFIRQVPIID